MGLRISAYCKHTHHSSRAKNITHISTYLLSSLILFPVRGNNNALTGSGVRLSRRASHRHWLDFSLSFFAAIVPSHQSILTPITHTYRYKQEFRREFSMFTSFGVSFSVLGLLPSIATTLWYGMGYAGTAGMVWGYVRSRPFSISCSRFRISSRATRHTPHATRSLLEIPNRVHFGSPVHRAPRPSPPPHTSSPSQ